MYFPPTQKARNESGLLAKFKTMDGIQRTKLMEVR